MADPAPLLSIKQDKSPELTPHPARHQTNSRLAATPCLQGKTRRMQEEMEAKPGGQGGIGQER